MHLGHEMVPMEPFSLQSFLPFILIFFITNLFLIILRFLIFQFDDTYSFKMQGLRLSPKGSMSLNLLVKSEFHRVLNPSDGGIV